MPGSEASAANEYQEQGVRERYPPIRDYALIGDCHGSALVSKDGSIDWCCLKRFDAAPIFCRILDSDKGGFFSIAPVASSRVNRAYLAGTNIVRTEFDTGAGSVSLQDFMPVGRRPGNRAHDYVRLHAPGWVVRSVEGLSGSVEMRLRFRPSHDYARKSVRLTASGPRVTSSSGPVLYHSLPAVEVTDDLAEAVFRVRAGETLWFVCAAEPTASDPLQRAEKLLATTRSFWEEWIAYCRYEGPHRDMVRRSALALKLLTYAPTGAIVAAPTTSLPEEIGGARNWDYRYCWLRDSALALYALAALGYSGEAECFSYFLSLACGKTAPDTQIMYGIEAEAELREAELPHLSGYRDSRPVRIGNGAYDQRQMDVFGEVLDWADLYVAIGGKLDKQSREMLTGLADFVTAHWREPDQGLWEMRGAPRHHVHGKIMSWVALDRAIKLFGQRADWAEARGELAVEIRSRGLSPSGALAQSFDSGEVDAAALMTPMLGFPLALETLEPTVGAVEETLRSGDFVHRYRTEDGLGGEEGAFFICSFWLVDALLLLDRAAEAEELFDRLLRCANDVGLYSEEIDTSSRAFLGNFPQAFTHLALIASASHLNLYNRSGRDALSGTYADRGRRLVGATFGWRGVWAAFKATRRVARLSSSRASTLVAGL